jgi:predicted dehydrogenase
LTRVEFRRLWAGAASAGVRVGNAPDTFLGAGLQTCRRLLDEGVIGVPVAAQAFMLCHGHEGWHPAPDFYYQPGGGPLFDMGPYYLTALIALLGPVRRVTASTRISFPQRIVRREGKPDRHIEVAVPTHLAGVMDFASGAIATLVTSFDVWASEAQRIEIFGSEGTLSVPDPNLFGGPVRLRLKGEGAWREVPCAEGFADNGRGIGVADMARAIHEGRPHRASGEMAFHVLDLMQAFHEASDTGRHVTVQSRCERPALL